MRYFPLVRVAAQRQASGKINLQNPASVHFTGSKLRRMAEWLNSKWLLVIFVLHVFFLLLSLVPDSALGQKCYCSVLYFTGGDIFSRNIRTRAVEMGFATDVPMSHPLGVTGQFTLLCRVVFLIAPSV